MKLNWYYIRMVILLALTVFIYGFSARRNDAKKINRVQINFEAGDNLFITAASIDRLLTQNGEHVSRKERKELVLNVLEDRLTANEMIDKAEVYLTLDGIVGVNVKQRKPIARIEGTSSYYLDERGAVMPLSPNYSARVPVINGVDRTHLPQVYPLIVYIKNDALLHKQIIGVKRLKNDTYRLIPRVMDYEIHLGNTEDLESKFNNYKAFYQKTLKDNSLETYRLVDLEFKGQVVGTKK